MPVYASYYDASGSERDGALPVVVAGLVATEAKWIKFEKAWQEALRYFRVPYYHSKEFAHSVGAFASWKGNEPMRREFVKHLLIAIKRNVNKGFVVEVSQQTVDTVDSNYHFRDIAKGPYIVVASSCVAMVHRWIRKRDGDAPIRHLVEKGDTGQGPLDELMRSEGIPVNIIPKKDDLENYVLPFQASDFVAYEFRSGSITMAKGTGLLRYPLRVLRGHFPLDYGTHDVESLSKTCAAHPEFFPPRRKVS